MHKQRLPYGARSEAEMQRNLARLGTKWQERELTHEERQALVCEKALSRAWWDGWFAGWAWGDWWRSWLLILGLGLCLTGCMDVAQWQLRTFYGLDCRQEVISANNGKCVPVKKGGSDVHTQTAQP